jgi:uncharacterized membrane protein
MQRFFVYLKSFLLTLVQLTGAASTHAKDAQLIKVQIDATVLPNGDVRMMESRTYQFDGSFSYAYRDLLKARVDSITDIRVSDANSDFRFDDSEQPRTYRIQQDNDKARVTWYYQAENEKRTFTIRYHLTGKLVVGPEWVELNHLFIGDKWEMDSENVTLNIHFAEPVRSELHNWIHSDVREVQRRPIQNGLRYTAPFVNSNEELAIRTVFPKELVPDAVVTHPDFSLEFAERQEQTRLESAAKQTQYQRIAYGVGIALVIISLVVFVWCYRKYGVRPQVPEQLPTDVQQLTSQYTPAEAAYLMQNGLTNAMIMATLFDLARRGYFTIQEQDETGWLEEAAFSVKRTDQMPRSNELKPHEQELYDYVCQQLTEGTQQLKKVFSTQGIGITTFTPQWKKTLKRDIEPYQWFDERSQKGRIYAMTIEGILALFGFATIFWAGPLGILAGLIPTTAFLASISIAHRTEEGQRLYKRLKAYKKQLQKREVVESESTPASLHFVFAIAFAISKGKMEKLIQKLDMNTLMGTWLIINAANASNAASVASSVTSLTSVATSSVAGASGASAGAAGGGGGGGVG